MPNLLERKSVIKVKEFLNKIDDSINLIVLDETARTAVDAANALKKEVGAIVKSLLFKNYKRKEYYLCLISGDKYLSLKKLSILIGDEAIKTDADECKEVTGFSIGGVSPFAHIQTPKGIFIDKNLNRYNIIYAAAGHPHVVFGIKFNDLVNFTKGKVKDITS